jgi:hypothetical protein
MGWEIGLKHPVFLIGERKVEEPEFWLVGVLVEVPWVNSVRNQVEIGPRQIPDFSTAARTLDMVTCPKGSQVSYAACH